MSLISRVNIILTVLIELAFICIDKFPNILATLPSLGSCSKASVDDITSLYAVLRTMRGYIELQTLTSKLTDYNSKGADYLSSQIKTLSDHSAYLHSIEVNFKNEWSDSSIENSSVLINTVSSVWLASRRLMNVRNGIQSILMFYCPPTYNMSSQEIDHLWENSYMQFEPEIAEICTSKSKVFSSIFKDTLVNWSDNRIDILQEKLEDEPFESNPTFNPRLYIAVKLHSLCDRLTVKCRNFHAYYSHFVIPSLNSILAKCPVILKNFDLIRDLVTKRPTCTFIHDCLHTYQHDKESVEQLKKKAKEFQNTVCISLGRPGKVPKYLQVYHA